MHLEGSVSKVSLKVSDEPCLSPLAFAKDLVVLGGAFLCKDQGAKEVSVGGRNLTEGVVDAMGDGSCGTSLLG